MVETEYTKQKIKKLLAVARKLRRKSNPKIALKCQQCIWAKHDGKQGICCMPSCKEGVK